MKKIIITGGSGLVGSNFVHFLAKNSDYKIYSLYNSKKMNFGNCENIKVDIMNHDDVLSLHELDANLIIHCAAVTGIKFCEENEQLAHDINVIGTKNVVELAKKNNAKLIYLSTDAVFDGVKGNYSDNDDPNPINVYGKTKLEGEKACMDYENFIIVRMSLFGKNLAGDKKSFLEDIIGCLKNKKEFNAFSNVINSPIYVKNVLDIIMGLYEKKAKGIFHLGSFDSCSKYEFVNLIAGVFGFDQKLVQKISAESVMHIDNIKLSKNCSFDISKIMGFLEKEDYPTVRDMLEDYKRDFPQ